MAARQRHHPTTALTEVDAGAPHHPRWRLCGSRCGGGPEACTLRRGGVIDVHGAAAAPAGKPGQAGRGRLLGGALPGAGGGRAQEEVAVR
jgi:hypothetical protein